MAIFQSKYIKFVGRPNLERYYIFRLIDNERITHERHLTHLSLLVDGTSVLIHVARNYLKRVMLLFYIYNFNTTQCLTKK